MERFFLQVVKKVFAGIDFQLRANTKAIVLVGGLSKSEYFIKLARARYETTVHPKFNMTYMVCGLRDFATQLPYVVCDGAHYRHMVASAPLGVEAKEAFGISQAVDFDPDVHVGESMLRPGQIDPKGRPVRTARTDYSVGERDELDPSNVTVYATWCSIKPYGTAYAPGETHITTKLQTRFVETEELEKTPVEPLLLQVRNHAMVAFERTSISSLFTEIGS